MSAEEESLEEQELAVPADWVIREKMFQETDMYQRLQLVAKEYQFPEFERALAYARMMHQGELRKPNKFHQDTAVPYIIHPLMMAAHACSLGLYDDQVLATVMLHDVCEDCGVMPQQLPFADAIRHSVALLTKHSGQSVAAYYQGIMTDPCASIVKALDRCNNVSTMAMSFTERKMIEYINETETYVYPLLEYIRTNDIQYETPVFAIKYQLMSLVETMKAMMMRQNKTGRNSAMGMVQ